MYQNTIWSKEFIDLDCPSSFSRRVHHSLLQLRYFTFCLLVIQKTKILYILNSILAVIYLNKQVSKPD